MGNLSQFRHMCGRLGISDESERQELFEKFDKDGSNELELDEFDQLLIHLKSEPDLQNIFSCATSGQQLMSIEQLHTFFREKQDEDYSLEFCTQLIETFGERDSHSSTLSGACKLDVKGFVKMFLQKDFNFVFDPSHKTVYQDMSQPLSHYYISSSHNTYLCGNQLTSRSSALAVEWALKRGARVVELDTYDGSDGEPVVTHGGTLTTSVAFRECIQAVAKQAFYHTQYPAIITIENHCSVPVQDKQAQILREELGDMLFIPEPTQNDMEFLSPKDLLGKVVIRDKVRAEDKMSEELSKLVYICNIPYGKHHDQKKAASSSMDEHTIHAYALDKVHEMVKYSKSHLSRVYPAGLRINSSNYAPICSWLCGCQIVALNFQYSEENVWENQGLFLGNGHCGYRLKPELLLREDDTLDHVLHATDCDAVLSITVISGHHLLPPENLHAEGEVVDPYVVVSHSGLNPRHFPSNCTSQFETDVVLNNGFNPKWNHTGSFNVVTALPNIIGFQVWHSRSFLVGGKQKHERNLLGQYYICLEDMRLGYRRVPLRDKYGRRQGLGYLFVSLHLIRL